MENTMENIEVLIIGGGASGLMAAISSARSGASVRILEKNDRIGRKILATGNGRCNFTNLNCAGTDFMGSEPDFASKALTLFGVQDTLNFFEELGLFHREESEGRIYPYSEQAVSVLDALESELNRLKVEVLTSSTVTVIKKNAEGFVVLVSGGRQYRADRVIIATGGKAGVQYGCSGDGYTLAKTFGHDLIEPRPALVQLVSDAPFFRQLKGIRAKGNVTLYKKYSGKEPSGKEPSGKESSGYSLKHRHNAIAQETGEIQFTETGLSGICIFNLSRYIKDLAAPDGGANLQKTKKTTNVSENTITIDLIPELSLEALREKLALRLNHCRHKALEDFLNGIVNKRLIPILLKECKFAGVHKSCETLDLAAIDKMAAILKEWPIKIIGTKGFQDAQTTTGGIDAKQIDDATFESKLIPGLYFTGEVLDVDGRCGGYNLQWAWTSGFLAGRAAAEKIEACVC